MCIVMDAAGSEVSGDRPSDLEQNVAVCVRSKLVWTLVTSIVRIMPPLWFPCALCALVALCACFRVCCVYCNGCGVYDVVGVLRALQWVCSVHCSGCTACIALGVVCTMVWAMCAVVVGQTSCNDRNHPILRGVIAPHKDFFFFLQKS